MMSAIGRIFGFVGRAIVILLVIGFVALLLEDDKPSKHLNHASSSNGAKVTDYATRIRPYAYQPYTADQYPKTVAEFGQRLPEIERHNQDVSEGGQFIVIKNNVKRTSITVISYPQLLDDAFLRHKAFFSYLEKELQTSSIQSDVPS